ncbi:esterase [Lutibacter sp. HS1-25]|uniref:alpha/beta hydrolase-fold protein n=1 Tax=Lutibacter sp. HS1-25 TaxID=2485000 RepID=UPI00101143B7|nr:alpha/beta hydrolase-fold protein [Lutibacter sp. HS1-25]RXP64664.1 esterase [Lutibacter sp. HS1-25]
MGFKLKIIVIFLFCNTIFGQEIATIQKIKINSKILNQEREILIYTPQSYTENTLVFYDVIYVFDAQNREFFDFTHAAISFISNATKKYIVVGITSPYIENLDYARNNDMLPLPKHENQKEFYNGYNGNADNFLNYIKNEVMPFVNSNFRTRPYNLAIGHSLSASFILYSMFKEPNLFNDYFAISPNLAYDKESLATMFLDFNSQNINNQTFLYLSNANEGENYWKEWLTARNKVYSFLEKTKDLDQINVVIKKFPNETHWSTFAPSFIAGFSEYFKYLENKKIKYSDETYEITLLVKVLNKDDEVFVTGNQKALGDWNPNSIKMNYKSEFEREINLKVKTPLELKFTRGSWETEGLVKNINDYVNLYINPIKQHKFEFEILEWADQME